MSEEFSLCLMGLCTHFQSDDCAKIDKVGALFTAVTGTDNINLAEFKTWYDSVDAPYDWTIYIKNEYEKAFDACDLHTSG